MEHEKPDMVEESKPIDPLKKEEVTWLKHIDISDDSHEGYALAAKIWLEKPETTDGSDKPRPVFEVSRVSSSSVQKSRANTLNMPPLKGLRCFISSMQKDDPGTDGSADMDPIIETHAPDPPYAPAVSISLLLPYIRDEIIPNPNTMFYIFCNKKHMEEKRALFIQVMYQDAPETGDEIEKNVVTYSYSLEHARQVGMNCYLQFLFTYGYAPDLPEDTLFGIPRLKEDGGYRELPEDSKIISEGMPKVVRFMKAMPDFEIEPADLDEVDEKEKEEESGKKEVQDAP